MPDASIIINNYNYGRYLALAIESALAQTGADTEVIVVDDGSTDDSREVIARYDDRVHAILKENGGQASALNAGFAASHAPVVIFLDADDLLAPTAAARSVECFRDPAVTKVHWHLRKIDRNGALTGDLWPRGELPRGDLRDALLRHGPSAAVSAPTSGNAWGRRFLEQVMPISNEYRLCADDYLYALAPAFGRIERIDEPQGYYRLHGENNYLGRTLEERIEFGVRVQQQQCDLLEAILVSQGARVDRDAWLKECWFLRLRRVSEAIEKVVAEEETLILIDDDLFGAGGSIAGRRALPMTERDGRYWGPPANDAAAVEELGRLAGSGATYVAIAWSSFWWLESYPVLRRLLESDPAGIENDDVVIFRFDSESMTVR
jgi:glycosyltransferase involved in cell wall biosynthesis